MSEFIVIGQRAEDGIAIDFSKPAVGELVRCKDCKYWKSNTEFCEFWSALNVAQRTCKNDYCSYGEKQEHE